MLREISIFCNIEISSNSEAKCMIEMQRQISLPVIYKTRWVFWETAGVKSCKSSLKKKLPKISFHLTRCITDPNDSISFLITDFSINEICNKFFNKHHVACYFHFVWLWTNGLWHPSLLRECIIPMLGQYAQIQSISKQINNLSVVKLPLFNLPDNTCTPIQILS